MTYKMFIDDERFPPDDGEKWVICRNWGDVTEMVRTRGFPRFISFDHDLGYGMASGYEIAHWLVEVDCTNNPDCVFPDDFDFYVHSQNPVGALNIESLLRRYFRFKKEGK